MIELKGAPFNRDDAALYPEAGACSNCPKMTGNNRESFPDSRGDICTDPDCFKTKTALHEKQVAAKATSQGVKMLGKKDRGGLFSPYNNRLVSSKFVDLADQCYQDPKKNKRSYKQLLEGSDVQVLGHIDGAGKLHKLVDRAAAEKVLKEKHKIEPRSGKAMEEKHKRQMQREAQERTLRKAAADRAIKLIAARQDWKPDLSTVGVLAASVVGREKVGKVQTIGKLLNQAFTELVKDSMNAFINGYGWGDRAHESNRTQAARKVLSMARIDLGKLIDQAKRDKAATKPKGAKGAKPVKATRKAAAKATKSKPRATAAKAKPAKRAKAAS